MKIIPITFLLLAFTFIAKSQSVTGTWYGQLNLPGVKLNIVFHLEKSGDLYSATMDSPDQGAKGIPTDKVTFSESQLVIEASNLKLTFTGTYYPDSNKISGTFQQGSSKIPLVLSPAPPVKESAKAAVARPQDPKDFPYHQEEVTFINSKAGNTLAGTLTLPANGKAKKVAILITGSGPQDRNEEIKEFNHRPFLVLSDWLTRQGIAVLRYDDRGVGKSTGVHASATSADFADDAEAAVTYLHSRTDLKNLSIGLVGHSEGGMIAPIVASRNTNVKFIVLLAGPGIPPAELMVQQNTDYMRLTGADTEQIDRAAVTNKKLYTLIRQNSSLPSQQINTKIDSLLYQEFSKYPAEALGSAKVEDAVKQAAVRAHTVWFHYFISFNPADYLSKVKCPVLALNGTLDSQVQDTQNLAGITESLKKAKNKSFQAVALPGLNHFFQKATTGSVSEYGEIQETMNPAALEKTSSWINAL